VPRTISDIFAVNDHVIRLRRGRVKKILVFRSQLLERPRTSHSTSHVIVHERQLSYYAHNSSTAEETK